VNLRRLAFVVFAVAEATGAAMLTAALIGVVYREWTEAGQIAVAAAIVVAAGEAGRRFVGRAGLLTVREGFAVIGLSWVAMTLVGTIPYLVTGSVGSFTDGVFEASSGFSTTGASIVADPGALSYAVLWWRALSQWLGGLGVIVIAVAVVPMLGIKGLGVVRGESTAGERRPLRVREIAKRLLVLYAAFTLVQAVLLVFSDMTLFEAVANAFTTMSTGGFTTRAGSMGAFSGYAQWVTVVFMVIAGTSFALHVKALREPGRYARTFEFRVYGLILALTALALTLGLWADGIGRAIRLGVFSAVSLVTTTGFTVTHPADWSSGLQILIIGLMFVGGMAGSAAGGIKTFRLAAVTNAARMDLRRMIHPLAVLRTRFGGDPMEPDVVGGARTFMLFYLLAFLLGTLVLGIIGAGMVPGDDLLTSASVAASALGNVGPGLGAVAGPGGYAALPEASRWLLSGLMIIGRLEIFPIALLFTRGLWRR
jgi:trk system potassium uptake protein TrkH